MSEAWSEIETALSELKVEYLHFDGVIANPTVDQVDSAFELFKGFSPGALIGIGGRSEGGCGFACEPCEKRS